MDKPLVSIVMGSDSDLLIVKEAAEILNEFAVSYETLVLSAHRSPKATEKYAKTALERGIKVIIAAAGGAAHLAGVMAAFFPLPVIGIPIKTKSLDGLDSLLSIVQMPPGVPVATVGINASKNAALLAIEILAVNDNNLRKKIELYKKQMAENVDKKNNKLNQLGVKKYYDQFKNYS
ncbi:5-(carboxyamino)imidazole ribonucleotide mutase [Candidatus Roizmanbacteria bacterium CG22_combo_CG10-13_8_21_14_all_35_9]|uniref:N5-carboxyaminoimidazole ribonucleotide mutase n=4 Tax=Candidatus Roizmaniibacteriota TaxID=1752723 RepID=A0A2M8F4V1_9BACT|nr:MAG: 5-(carboxyamino)imidazole ribonucleotide mutase [Candidatus Roizmanbacteria bacterium CG23_combo_of_CG06-09_8_20_14_all_35_49]PIP62436.1 MAG: 5-(carboxyamino)imidazole ribonucleotide mutase [Candidatus Roizmanbacteria bacterium CG22_combo_CG10-13_8_21_14_all_35_9]PIY71157.1 MAG: 5-(carboxyamino)imidazole ribonucleotide mutase [Candidatus Roizmanbacteria bacterium CG_4_10_14_0_8_um_filter_35_28]PJC34325.1 MAG: 5-(carboxyamino)imidazole ribonucleotide mutase [Candidatus Roizmanbacteria bac